MIVFSVWNIGEVLGALDQRRRRGYLRDGEFSAALFNFTDETLRLIRQGSLTLAGITGPVMTESWRILLEEHLYAADALQIASSKRSECNLFVSADRNLLGSSRGLGLEALDPEKDEKKIRSL